MGSLALALILLMQRQGIQPTVVTWSAGMTACARQRRWELGLALLSKIRTSGNSPDAVASNAAIAACQNAGRWLHAVALLVAAPGQMLPDGWQGRNAAIGACAKGRAWERAILLLAGCDSEPPCLESVNAVLLCSASQRWGLAVWLLGKLLISRLAPDLVTLRGVTEACAVGGAGSWLRIMWMSCAVQLAAFARQAPDCRSATAETFLEVSRARATVRTHASLPVYAARVAMRGVEVPTIGALRRLSRPVQSPNHRWPTLQISTSHMPQQHWRVHDAALEDANHTSALCLRTTWEACTGRVASVERRLATVGRNRSKHWRQL